LIIEGKTPDQPVFADYKMHGRQVCEAVFDQGLCVSKGTNLAEDQQDRATTVIRAYPK